MSAELNILVTIHTKPGHRDEQINFFAEIAPVVRAEEGCLRYDLFAVEGDDDRFILIEKWASAETLAAHQIAPHMVAAAEKTPAFRAGPVEATVLKAV